MVEVDDRTATVLEGTKTFSTSDISADFNAGVVSDAADQHGTDGDDGDFCSRLFASDDHDTASVFAEDVEGAFFVDGLGVHCIVCAGDLGDRLDSAGYGRVPTVVVLRCETGDYDTAVVEI